MNISFYDNAAAKKPSKHLSTEDVITMIKKPSTEFKERLEALRIETDESIQARMKRLLPAVTWSGTFNARSTTGLLEHSGMYCYDLDDLGGESPSKMKKVVSYIDSLVCAFTSPRGEGLKVILMGKVGDHREIWETGAAIVEEATHLKVDRSGSDVCRLCFLSHDPRIVIGKGEAFDCAEKTDEVNMDGIEADTKFPGYTIEHVREMLWTVGSECDYDTWRDIIFAVTSALGRGDAVYQLLHAWSVKCGGTRALKTDEDMKAFDGVFKSKGKGITLATLIKMAREKGWEDWRRGLRRDEDGKIIHDDANLRCILECHPDFKGRFWSDSLSDLMMFDKRDKVVSCRVSREGGLIEEHLAFDVLCDIQTNLGIGFRSTKNVLLAMIAIAKQRIRNLRREWLSGLKWDGIPRLGRLFIDGFGAEDKEHNEALGIAFLSGAAARVLSPGSSVQVVPILVGEQGVGKSSGIAALLPDPSWFCDSIVDFESKAGYEVVCGATIVELPELSALKKADIEKVKQFVTQRQVKYRTPWDRQARVRAATWVFIGTTNEEEFLKDTTGNRRFAPIRVVNASPSKIVDWISERRDQLWAEAREIAEKGLACGRETWAIPKKYWEDLAREAENAREKDPWEDAVQEVTNRLQGSSDAVLRRLNDLAMECGVTIRSRIDELHFGKLLRRMGWNKRTVRDSDGVLGKKWTLDPL